MDIKLRRMTPQDQPALAGALPEYIDEVSPDLDHDPHKLAAWHIMQDSRVSFWILNNMSPVGFALTFQQPSDVRELTEFYIHPKVRRNGMGKTAAHRLFGLFPGNWALGVTANPPQAADFWADCLVACPGIKDIRKRPPKSSRQAHSYTFTITGRRL